uniref:C-C motif chemokine n=1 Tax=Sinocyclocheilus rhinocerous TaxID=307959 RepID=A0A673N3G6_9TELE
MVAALSVLRTDASALCKYISLFLSITFSFHYSCCRKYTKGIISMTFIKGYSIQTMTRNCHIDAVIFHTYRGKNICTDPTKAWVMENIRKLREKVQVISRKHSRV